MPGKWWIFHAFRDQETSNLVGVLPLTADRHAELVEAKSVVSRFFGSQNVVQSVVANRDDVLAAIVLMAKQYLDNKAAAEEILENSAFDIARLFANMCSLFRSFLDHFDRYFVEIHGKSTDEYKSWKKILGNEYDNHASYRIIYAMRNFIQHYDMPPLSMSIEDRAGEEGFTTSIYLDVAELIKDQGFRKKLPAASDCNLALLPIIHEWSECFDRIVSAANSIRIRDVIPAAHKLVALRRELKLPDTGKLALVWLPEVDRAPENLSLSLDYVPEEKAEYIIALRPL